MKRAILAYATVTEVNKLISWISGGVAVALTLRLLMDLFNAYQDPEVGLKEAIQKGGNRIKAVIIGITASALITWISSYY